MTTQRMVLPKLQEECPMAKKSPRVHRTFTPQFKKDAVALVRGRGGAAPAARAPGGH